MKKHEVKEEFILEAHKEACSKWKSKIEKQFPDLFKNKLEIGKWYYYKYYGGGYYVFNFVALVNGTIRAYGIDSENGWFDETHLMEVENRVETANKELVERELIKEAKKRGLKDGVVVNSMFYHSNGEMGKDAKTELDDNLFMFMGMYVLNEDEWSTIQEAPQEITIAEIEKELGRKIKLVK